MYRQGQSKELDLEGIKESNGLIRNQLGTQFVSNILNASQEGGLGAILVVGCSGGGTEIKGQGFIGYMPFVDFVPWQLVVVCFGGFGERTRGG